MCGIIGFYGSIQKNPWKAIVAHLYHRGPDDRGMLFWDGKNSPTLISDPHSPSIPGLYRVALIHTRLSILDLSKAGWQPMGTPDGRFFIIYNGEVYNYKEIQQDLQALGYTFRSRTDTEVVLYAFAAWGPDALQKFIGMFAFAILDVQKRELFLARDFFGIKPLYYTFLHDGGFAFASEIKVLLPLLSQKPRVNPARLYDYLRFGYTDHAQDTLFQGIYHLPPAHYMRVPVDYPHQAQIYQYWSIPSGQTLDISFESATKRLRDIFLESVRLHLRSDVPIGTALSGGIDSSSIVCAIRYIDPKAEIHAFSFVAEEDPVINEEKWVHLVGEWAHIHLHKVRAYPGDIIKDIDNLIYAQDEPFASTSIYAQYLVFRLAKEHGIKVMLDGQGADEMLAGYPTYYASRLLSLLWQQRYREAWRFLQYASRLPASQGRWAILKRLAHHLLPSPLQGPARRLVGEELFPAWMNWRWFVERGVWPHAYGEFRGPNALREHLKVTFTKTSLPALLRYEDRNSMWHSIESRVPFLTPQLVRFVFSLPEEYLLSSQGITKAVFREAMRGIVPDAILERRDKIGFRTPEWTWLTALRPWVGKLLQSEIAHALPVLNIKEVWTEWEAMLQGKRPYSSYLWRWVNLIRWTEIFEVQYE